MARGLEAIRSLLDDVTPHRPERIALVATSAVRDAANGAEFRTRVRAITGHEIQILDGVEEAALIGRGLTSDPALADLNDFYVFDLGGGSLECLEFRQRKIEQAVSLQLGCVRLMEKFVRDPAEPLRDSEAVAIMNHTRDTLGSRFRFDLPAAAAAIGTGGTVTTVRAITGAREGKSAEETDATVPLATLRDLLGALGSLPLPERKRIPGLPSARADVFPTALATLLAVANAGGFTAYRNSLRNLRFGVAAELLDAFDR
jgi:exopolyphosphatase/guanosine-5'-triphosphate,3'-diphosphate pyrophosphatase